MEPTAIIFGVGITSFLLVYFAYKIDDTHPVMRFITVFVAIAMLLIIPKAIIDYPTNCSIIVDEQNTTSSVAGGVTTTSSSLGYAVFCDTSKDAATILLHGQMIFMLILAAYLFFYLCYFLWNVVKKRKRI